jgi:23S rRNA (uracil1939-C5)-methyltransferase
MVSMARGEIFSARIGQIAAGGAGIARIEGKSVFIDLTAPGDLVKASIKSEHKSWAEGEALEILEPSPQRVLPVCRYYGNCGGCSLQHLNYEAQLEAKIAILRDACRRIGGFVPAEIRLHRSAPFEYRNRFRFHRTPDGSPGFKERRSSRLVAIKDCPVAEKGIRNALGKGEIKAPVGMESFAVYSKGSTFLSEGGVKRGTVSIRGRELQIDAGVFFQSNAAMFELLIGELLELASGADKSSPLADIYCGVGTFASLLGDQFQEIDLVEENKTALAIARENMPSGKKVNYYAMPDTAWARSQKKKYKGLMILDPPRGGLSKPFREWLSRSGPELAAYVSCDPATMARDSRFLLEGGYSLKELSLYDFYPQTAHIEGLAVFYRA